MSRLGNLAQALSPRIPAYHIAVDDLLQLTRIRTENDVAESPPTFRNPSAQRCDQHALPDRLAVPPHCLQLTALCLCNKRLALYSFSMCDWKACPLKMLSVNVIRTLASMTSTREESDSRDSLTLL